MSRWILGRVDREGDELVITTIELLKALSALFVVSALFFSVMFWAAMLGEQKIKWNNDCNAVEDAIMYGHPIPMWLINDPLHLCAYLDIAEERTRKRIILSAFNTDQEFDALERIEKARKLVRQ